MNVENLSKFTDILDEICDSQPLEICDSQPLSLTSSNNTPVHEEDIVSKSYRPPKCTGQKGNFRSVEEIDPKYQHIFTYRYFNLVQSKVIEDALYSNKSIVVCAPTGSGKTVVFEMAIVQLLMELEDRNYTGDFKIIYMAPVKALCTERLTEWHSKFTKLGLLSIEVTGDTNVELPQLQPYRIIITTPEKWDMLTRRWKDHRSLVEVVKLFLIDEVHILNDEIRGPVLEAVVSRMKTIETSVQTAHRIEQLQAQFQGADVQFQESPPRVRFVAVSATVSNPEDVAAWLGNKEQPAAYYKFGDECRPVKLKRVVEGYPCPIGTSIFKFDIILNYKLWPILKKYHNGKPTLIFCNTRKGVLLTAEALSREITVGFNEEQKSKLVALASTLKNKKVQSLVLCGVGCHYAGLLYEERTNIEQAFRNRDLPILITTTTLAMGVNLPAHLVIIKNTQQYVNGAYQEYSISTVLQMVGRAGRPQYDTEATAVIMTRQQDKARYQALVGGCEPLQSYLHKRLAENLNSEAALGTVSDVAQCVQWVNSTFLSVRAVRDPKRYLSLPPAAPPELISKKIEELCVRAMNGLASAGLITMDEVSCIESTEAGRLMSLYYLDLETMKLIMKLEGTESLEGLLWLVCESHELSDMHLRVDERRCLNALNRNSAAATIRYPMKGKISSRQMKLSCVIQAVLGCLPIPDPSLNQEAMKIMRTADRVCKCLVSYVTRPNLISQHPKFYSAILNSLILAKCISAHLWENSPYVSRQLKGIGPTYGALLAAAGKTNFMVLEESHPRDLERIMNKGPPAGNILRKQISLLPKYNLTMTPVNEKIVRIQLSLLNQAHLAENMDNLTAGANHRSYVIVGDSENYLLYFTTFKESDLIYVYDGCITFEVTRKHTNEHKVFAHCISSTLVGIDEKCEYLFMDINPLTEANVKDHFTVPETLEKRHNMNQTTITDVFKDRKRKLFNQNDTIQSKEKRKRDNNIIDTFNTLKESLEKTAKEIKVDFNKKCDMSHNLLQNLTKTNLPLTEKCTATKSLYNVSDDQCENEYLENAFSENFEIEDTDIDEEQVNGILSEIENEIKGKTEPNASKQNQLSYFHKRDPVKYSYKRCTDSYKNVNALVNRRKLNTKNNYTFLDTLQDKDSNDDNDLAETKGETGFSETVKSEIEKYLQRAQEKFRIKNSILVDDVIDSSNKMIDINVKDSIDLTNDESLQSCKDVNNRPILNSIVSDDNNRKAEKDQFNENVKESIDLTKYESIKNIERETKNSDHFLNSINDETKPQLDVEDQFQETSKSFNLSTKERKEKEINSLCAKNFIPCQSDLQVLPYIHATNNIVTSTEQLKKNLKDTILKDSDKVVDENKQYSISNFFPRLEEALSNKLPFSANNEVQMIAPVDSQPNLAEKEINLTNLNNFHNYAESNNSEIPPFEHNIEKINTYSFGRTNTFNIYTENSSKQQVQIISKLKLDLDVTEKVYKKDELSPESNEDNLSTKHKHNPKKTVSKTIADNDRYNKVTILESLPKKRLIMNPFWFNEEKRDSELIGLVKCHTDYKESYSKINNCQINLPLQNCDKYCHKSMLFTKDNKLNDKDNTYKLQKPSNTINRQNTSVYEIQKFKRNTSCNNRSAKVVMAKSSRKFKITDRANLHTSSHQSLMVENKNTIAQKAIGWNLMEKAKIENEFEIQHSKRNQQFQSYSTQSESTPFNIIPENIGKESHNSDMLTLLNSCNDHSLNLDSDEIIAPPPEFCDDDMINSSTNYGFNDNKLTENSADKHSTEIVFDVKLKTELSEANKISKEQDKAENVESIADNKETFLGVNSSKDKSENSSVKDILQKFSNIFKRKATINTNNNFEIKNDKYGKTDNQDTKTTTAKTSRKWKIRDIDKIQILLPQALTVKNPNTASQNYIHQRDNLLSEAAYGKHYDIQQKIQNIYQKDYNQGYSIQKSESTINIDDYMEEESPEIILSSKTLSPLYSFDDFDLNQPILNPKTLLECMNKTAEDENIDTRPPEFCYNKTSTYSPLYCDSFNADKQNAEEIISQDQHAHSQNDLESLETIKENNDVLDLSPLNEVETWTLSQENLKKDNDVLGLSPPKEIETWTLPQENFKSELFNNSDNATSWHIYNSSYTAVRNNFNENQQESHIHALPKNSRQAKLSYFKFLR